MLIYFLAASFVLWAAALPLAARLFKRFPDAGAGLAFPLGALLTGVTYFLLRTASVIDVGRGGYLAVTGLLVAAGFVSWGAGGRHVAILRRRPGWILFSFFLFSAFFLAFSFYRSHLPDIGGTEQPMDFMFMNATITSPSYPPEDPWLAGEPISYYYLGYVEAGFLSQLAAVPPETGYNLSLAWVFGAAAAATWSVAYAAGRAAMTQARRHWPAVGAALAVIIVLGSGSLIGAFEWAAAHEHYDATLYEAFGAESLLPCGEDGADPGRCYGGPSPRTDAWYPEEFWFWFGDTRTIPGTITEFPVFSFLLGDLHPHVMAIPLVLLAIALSFATWRTRRVLSLRSLARDPTNAALTVIILGGLAFMNAWDLITFTALFVLAAWGRAIKTGGSRGLLSVIPALGILFGLAALVYLPWALTFSSQAAGLYAYSGTGTRPAHALLQFGPIVIPALGLLGWGGLTESGRSRAALIAGVLLVAFLLVAWATLASVRGELGQAVAARDSGWVTLGIYAAFVAVFTTLIWGTLTRGAPAAPVLTLAGVGLLLLLGTELFLIRDVFFGSVPRMNTVFKLSYQAWLLLGIAGGIGLAGLLRRVPGSSWRAGLAAAGCLTIAVSLVFPLIAVPNRTAGSRGERSLNGLRSLELNNAEEYALVTWLRENVKPGELVVEATGRKWGLSGDGTLAIVSADVDYSGAGRISARTGFPTAVGWYFHEVQWRGDGVRGELDRRQRLVDAAYTSPMPSDSLRALRALDAVFVVVGSVERSNYPGEVLTDFDAFLDLVWEEGATRVYRLPRFELVPAP